MTDRRGLLLMLGAAPLLGGCISLLPDPGKPVPVLGLEADPALAPLAQPVPFALGVALPVMDRFIATNRVVVREASGGLANLEGVRLTAGSAYALQTLLLETVERLGMVRAVVRAESTARPEFELQSAISKFEVTLPNGGAGSALIEGSVALMRTSDGHLLGSRMVRATGEARRGDPTEAVMGLQEAARGFARDVCDWAVAQLRAQPTG